jgi:glycosyltransferase involved in cell wall biosynthesis
MKICYFGHPAHEWSKSTVFFEDILRTVGDLHIFRPNPINVDELLRNAIETEYDLYVFFQFDFLAYSFLAAGKPVVIIPMIDGSASYGSTHWSYIKNANFVSFSKSLHSFLKTRGSNSFSIQYWPEPEPFEYPEEKSIYYWPRGVSATINVRSILKTFESYPELKLRVRASDSVEWSLDYSRVNSDRLEVLNIETRIEHLNSLRECCVFVAPRASEGIGHSFLESMSLGRAVIARKYPTMSEYIEGGLNGFFFRENAKPLPVGIDWRALSKNAHDSVVTGHEQYLLKIHALSDYIENSALDKSKSQSVSSIHKFLDLSSAIMRKQKFPEGSFFTLQNWIRMVNRF